MWVATRNGQTSQGSVARGRLVPDDDPMLDGAEDGLFVRVGKEDAPVEEATAEPGAKRSSRRG